MGVPLVLIQQYKHWSNLSSAVAMSEMLDVGTSTRMRQISRLKVDASPGSEKWTARLKEELAVLVQYIRNCKEDGNDWFTITPSQTGLNWHGKCWWVYNMLRYEFDFNFELPALYPVTAPEIRLPGLIGKTPKQYRGGAICLTAHFKPLWKVNSPSYGIAHALCMGLGPWLAAEIPYLAASGAIEPKA